MKYLITKAHITLNIESDNIEKVRTEIAEYFGVETTDVHFNYEAIKEFEDETGIEVISLNSERIEMHYSNGGECDHTFEFKMNAK